jgi:hypothetical protein
MATFLLAASQQLTLSCPLVAKGMTIFQVLSLPFTFCRRKGIGSHPGDDVRPIFPIATQRQRLRKEL